MPGEPGREEFAASAPKPGRLSKLFARLRQGKPEATAVPPTQPPIPTTSEISNQAKHIKNQRARLIEDALKAGNGYAPDLTRETGAASEPLPKGTGVNVRMTDIGSPLSLEQTVQAITPASSIVPPPVSEADLQALLASEAARRVMEAASEPQGRPLTHRRRLTTIRTGQLRRRADEDVAAGLASLKRGLQSSAAPAEETAAVRIARLSGEAAQSLQEKHRTNPNTSVPSDQEPEVAK